MMFPGQLIRSTSSLFPIGRTNSISNGSGDKDTQPQLTPSGKLIPSTSPIRNAPAGAGASGAKRRFRKDQQTKMNSMVTKNKLPHINALMLVDEVSPFTILHCDFLERIPFSYFRC